MLRNVALLSIASASDMPCRVANVTMTFGIPPSAALPMFSMICFSHFSWFSFLLIPLVPLDITEISPYFFSVG